MIRTGEWGGLLQKGKTYLQQLEVSSRHRLNDRFLSQISREVLQLSPDSTKSAPIMVFNASTRITGLSQNAAFSLLSAWMLRLSGARVIHYVCSQGMSRCVLGTNREDVWRDPPCSKCIAQSHRFFNGAEGIWFGYTEDRDVHAQIETMNIQQLMSFTSKGIPLGELVLPSMRWVLRRHHLFDDHNTKFLYRQFILSADNIQRDFEARLAKEKPNTVLVFNGMFFPEATIRHVAKDHGIRVITHEAGIRPFSGFFTEGEATAYPIAIPKSFKLKKTQNQCLDSYLESRFKGHFSMADIQFWPEMNRLSEDMLKDIKRFKQVVPIFTNVIFDTSQPHSNVIYPDMFTWLEDLLPVFRRYPKTLFIIRAHPDETRPGKTSQETVAEWVLLRDVEAIPNVRFIPPEQYVSSYDLIRLAKFVMVYNSTIGLEASILGMPVLSAGRARFTQYPTVYFPKTQRAYLKQLGEFLSARKITPQPSHKIQARRFLYYQLFRTSLSFEQFVKPDGIWPGFVKLNKFSTSELLPGHSDTGRIITRGFQGSGPFLTDE